MKKNVIVNFCQFSFATHFIRNTYKFYNFIRNNYSQKNYMSNKIFIKSSRKKSLHANFFYNFTRKFLCNMRIFSGEFLNCLK